MGFSDDIRRFTVKTEAAHNKIVRAATIELFSGVIKSTPVLTGAARGAWATTVGKPSDGVDDRLAGQLLGKFDIARVDGRGEPEFTVIGQFQSMCGVPRSDDRCHGSKAGNVSHDTVL